MFVKAAAKEACWQISQTDRGSRVVSLLELGAGIEVVVVRVLQLQRDDHVYYLEPAESVTLPRNRLA